MDSTTWRAYVACAISFYVIVGVDLATATSRTDANLTAFIGLSVAVVNLTVFGGWTVYNRGVKA